MAIDQPRILVLTLHTDEPQLERCVAAVRSQEDVIVEHRIISGLRNLEAHRELYSTIESRSADFDLFVKVDADMVLAGTGVLAKVADLFVHDPDLDHAQLAIQDFYTDQPIMGLHAFSPRSRWQRADELMFVDPAPIVPGHRTLLWEPPLPVALHSPDPSQLQAFRFGVHRASKAFQPGRTRVRGSQAREQWRTLVKTWEAFVRHGDATRGLAIYGADLVWRGEVDPAQGDYRSEQIEIVFESAPKDPKELRDALGKRWHPGLRRAARHAWSLGARGTTQVLAAAVRQDLTSSEASNRELG